MSNATQFLCRNNILHEKTWREIGQNVGRLSAECEMNSRFIETEL